MMCLPLPSDYSHGDNRFPRIPRGCRQLTEPRHQVSPRSAAHPASGTALDVESPLAKSASGQDPDVADALEEAIAKQRELFASLREYPLKPTDEPTLIFRP